MTNETVEVNVEQFRLLVDLAGAARNPRARVDIAAHVGGSARALAARRAHDEAEQLLREVDNGK